MWERTWTHCQFHATAGCTENQKQLQACFTVVPFVTCCWKHQLSSVQLLLKGPPKLWILPLPRQQSLTSLDEPKLPCVYQAEESCATQPLSSLQSWGCLHFFSAHDNSAVSSSTMLRTVTVRLLAAGRCSRPISFIQVVEVSWIKEADKHMLAANSAVRNKAYLVSEQKLEIGLYCLLLIYIVFCFSCLWTAESYLLLLLHCNTLSLLVFLCAQHRLFWAAALGGVKCCHLVSVQ